MAILIPHRLSVAPPYPPVTPTCVTNRLWRVSADGAEGREVHCLKGHAARLALCAFHPSGRFLGTTSWDHTWRCVRRQGGRAGASIQRVCVYVGRVGHTLDRSIDRPIGGMLAS